jgi:ureidoglycolate hydrolase
VSRTYPMIRMRDRRPMVSQHFAPLSGREANVVHSDLPADTPDWFFRHDDVVDIQM